MYTSVYAYIYIYIYIEKYTLMPELALNPTDPDLNKLAERLLREDVAQVLRRGRRAAAKRRQSILLELKGIGFSV